MNDTHYNIDGLFDLARNEAPVITFQKTQSVFALSLSSGISVGFSFWSQLLSLKNGIIMLGIGSIALISLVLAQAETNVEKPTEIQNQFVGIESEAIVENPKPDKDDLRSQFVLTNIEKADLSNNNENKNEPEQKLLKEDSIEENTMPIEQSITFYLSEKSGIEEIEEIRLQAAKNGIKMNYKMGGDPLQLQKVTIRHKNRFDDSQFKSEHDGNFMLQIGWVLDEKGRVVRLNNSCVKKENKDSEPEVPVIESSEDMIDQNWDIEQEDKEYEEHEYNSERAARDLSNLKRVSFSINQNTGEEELQAIQKAAIDAGIDFQYTARVNNGRIKHLEMYLYINTEEDGRLRNSFHIHSNKKEKFNINVIWRIDEEGVAVDFDGKDGNRCWR